MTIAIHDILPGVRDPSGVPSFWRRHAAVLRGAVDPAPALDEGFASWCLPPAVARLYERVEGMGPGWARTVVVPDVTKAMSMAEKVVSAGRPLTVLLNRVDHVSPAVRRIRDVFGIGLEWRWDDVVATLSPAGSGIGYHVGHEDGFIVQLAGSRLWRVWPSTAATPEHALAVLGWRPGGDPGPPHRSTAPPEVEVELRAGDAVYVPALAPHEGVTLEGPSVSLSIGWRAINGARVFEGAGVDGLTPDGDGVAAWHRPFDDPAIGEDARHALVEQVARACELVLPSGCSRPDVEDIVDRFFAKAGRHAASVSA